MYRAHHPGWAFAPESGEGAERHGGRFNPRGIPALYTSLRLQTAWLEAQQSFAFKAQPMTLVAYQVECADVIDLTDPAVRGQADTPEIVLACPWRDFADRRKEPRSWALARRLIAAGCAAALVPSFAIGAGPGDLNAVFWRWGGAPPHRVTPIDEFGRLPRDRLSWR